MQALRLDAEWAPRPGTALTERERTTRRAFDSSRIFRHPTLSLVELPVPKPSAGDVLVRVRACGVCGSDVHICERDADGYVAYGDHAKLPVVLGHEWSGEVVDVAPDVHDLKRGDPVCVEPMNWCGGCEACRSGMVNQCTNLEEIGFSVDGGLAEYATAKRQYCWKLDRVAGAYPDAGDLYEAGALVEPCGVAYNAMFVRAGGFVPGGYVAVFGTGPIGLVAIALARTAGAAGIIALETSPERRELAKQMGADITLDPIELASDAAIAGAIMAGTGEVGVAMAVEAAGATQRTYPVIERVVAIGGKVVQIGIGVGQTPVTLVSLQQKGASVYGSMGNSGHGIFPNVIRLMASKRLDLRPMITARYPLSDAAGAIARAADRRDGKVLVVI